MQLTKELINQNILQKAKSWLSNDFDEITRKEVENLIDNNPQELIEAFYQDLEFEPD